MPVRVKLSSKPRAGSARGGSEIVSLSVAELFAGAGSLEPEMVTVLLIVPVAVALTVAFTTVKVAVPPFARLTVVAMFPLPLGGATARPGRGDAGPGGSGQLSRDGVGDRRSDHRRRAAVARDDRVLDGLTATHGREAVGLGDPQVGGGRTELVGADVDRVGSGLEVDVVGKCRRVRRARERSAAVDRHRTDREVVVAHLGDGRVDDQPTWPTGSSGWSASLGR